jgi:hypothetical protein
MAAMYAVVLICMFFGTKCLDVPKLYPPSKAEVKISACLQPFEGRLSASDVRARLRK